MKINSQLSIRELKLLVRLGCTEQERAIQQQVHISIQVDFLHPPQACQTDQLVDTICYAQITQLIQNICSKKEYATIEHLATVCFSSLEEIIPSRTPFQLLLHKIHPPISVLSEGVSFSMGRS